MKKSKSADLNNGLGTTLRALRKMRGMTQAEVAEAAGLERTSVTNIERGNQMLNVRTVTEIANALGYDVRVKFIRRQEDQPYHEHT